MKNQSIKLFENLYWILNDLQTIQKYLRSVVITNEKI